jgi:hypothetical protein
VGNVTLSYTNTITNFPRSYIRGFVGGNYLSNFRMSGNDLLFDYAPANLNLSFRVADRFYPPSSNTYSVPFVLDVDNCFCYQFGIPFPVLTYVGFWAMKTEPGFRIWVASDVPADENLTADLPPLSSYWQPQV